MDVLRIEQQRHGYVGGHQLLASSTTLSPEDQDVVDRLSDIGGQPGPDETVPEYLTGYPLPSTKYFAFARTLYDTSAPRSGCVLTHTLLVPSGAWSSAKSLLALARLHAPFDRERAGRGLPALELTDADRVPYPICLTKGLAELCEAVLLEQRQPIVWFTEPNDDTVLRLVEALWPAMRAQFAFQSYALKPRSKANGLFDLMAAPRSARSRFAAWDGRRVEGSAPPRHQFTPLLVQSVFGTPHPDLEVADPLGVLARDEVGDASKLRLSMLWNSLRGSGRVDPDATLGMLDVLTAAALPDAERWKRAEPLFRKIFEVACSRNGRAADLMALALGKLEQGDGERLSDVVAHSVAALSRLEPGIGVRLASTLWRDPSANPLVRQAVAEALTELPGERLWSALGDAPLDLTAELVEREPDLLIAMARHSGGEVADWAWVASLLDRVDDTVLNRTRLGILDNVRRGAQASLLRKLFSGVPVSDLTPAMRRMDRAGGFADAQLLHTFASLENPRHAEKLDALVAAKLAPEHAQVVFDALLRPSAQDIDWLIASEVPARVRTKLLARLLEGLSKSDFRKTIVEDERRLSAALTILVADQKGDDMAVRLVTEAGHLGEAAFGLAVGHFGSLRSPQSLQVVASLIEQVTPLTDRTQAERLDKLLGTTIGPEAARLVAPSIVDLLFPERSPDEGRTYSLALQLAARLTGTLRDEFIALLPTVSARSSTYRTYRLDPQAYLSWASLVDQAVSQGGETARLAAESALAYVVRREFETLLPLVVSSFPTVFNAALGHHKKGRQTAHQLAKTVTRLFLRNEWDAKAFITLASQVEDFRVLLEAMLENRRGHEFLQRGFDQLDRKVGSEEAELAELGPWHRAHGGGQ